MVFGLIQAGIVIGMDKGNIDEPMTILLQALHALAWTMITLAARQWTSFLSERPRMIVIAGHLLAILLAAAVDAMVRRGATAILVAPVSVTFARTMTYYADITVLSYLFSVWLGKVIDAREALIAQTRRELALRSQLARARLSYLHAQLQPHFLFNALGTVSELVFENPAAAVHTFKQLGAVLRAAASRDSSEIPLREEVEGLMPYLDVQRTRFSDWLEIEIDIDPSANELRVPPLILQPLVENSIRHGLRGRSSRGKVSIAARTDHGKLVLSVRDNGVGMPATSAVHRIGVGLANTRERLDTLYGKAGELRLFNDKSGGAVAEVLIPATTSAPPQIEPDGVITEKVEAPRSFMRRHPVISLIAGCILSSALWTQQSYAYLKMTSRLGDQTLLGLAANDFALVAMWFAMIPVIVWLSRRFPIAGPRWIAASFAHLGFAGLLGLADAWGVVQLKDASVAAIIPMFRDQIPITLLVYLVVLAWSQRRMFEEWISERNVAALRINAEITEARIAAASMAVAPESLDFTLNELERYASDNPLKAEQAIARLGSELRSTLEAGLNERPQPAGSGGSGPVRGENGVERLAMGA